MFKRNRQRFTLKAGLQRSVGAQPMPSVFIQYVKKNVLIRVHSADGNGSVGLHIPVHPYFLLFCCVSVLHVFLSQKWVIYLLLGNYFNFRCCVSAEFCVFHAWHSILSSKFNQTLCDYQKHLIHPPNCPNHKLSLCLSADSAARVCVCVAGVAVSGIFVAGLRFNQQEF